jgi:ubiquinone/menaquinone biosynthesis C-methylase UbiE
MENRYDDWHHSHNDDNDINTPWHNFVKENIIEPDINGKKILEIGCGRGGFSNYLQKYNNAPKEIVACDYSASALKIAEKKHGSASGLITWQREDIMALSFDNNSFDTIISCETIEHVPNPKSAIMELYRVLKPGGRLLLTCPNYFNVFGIWCLYRYFIKKPFTEGGQPYVNYVLFPRIYSWIKGAGFLINLFQSSEIIIPARVPKHFWNHRIPFLLKPFGYRTYFVLSKTLEDE